MDYKKCNVSLAVARMLAPNLVSKVEDFVTKYGYRNDVIRLIKESSDETKGKLTKLHDEDLKDEVEALKQIYPSYLMPCEVMPKYDIMATLIRNIIWYLCGRTEVEMYKYSNRYCLQMREPDADIVIINGKEGIGYIFSPRLREYAGILNLNVYVIEGINCSICRTCDIESLIKRLHIVGAEFIHVVDINMP